jgi:hypothetical protein
MTFDAAQSADWGTAIADLRDNVSGLTGWSVNEDSTGGAAQLTPGDYFVLTTPTLGSGNSEDIYIGFDSSAAGLVVQHGPSWNSGTSSWDDQFTYDPFETEDFYEGSTYNAFSDNVLVHPKSLGTGDSSGDAVDENDTGTYWMEYVERGFGIYWQREVGDGDDEDIFFGASEVQKAWAYDTASEREAEFVLGFGDSNVSLQRLIHMSESGTGTSPKQYDQPNNEYVARGLVNPDNNLDNYPLTNNILASAQYTTPGGETTVIGDHNLWINDISGSETGHKDLIQDAGSTDIYTILKRQDTPGIGLRMD